MQMKQSLLISMVPMILFGGTSVSLAQEAPAEKSELTLEEIVVTSRRVEESLQDVPLAITALTPQDLVSRGFEQLQDLQRAVPSFQATPTTGRRTSQIFAIRGQKADDVLLTQDQAVSVYIGGVVQGFPYGAGVLGALDVASLEVAKGPQGTLFGRNTTGGAVVITPNEPTDQFEGSVRIGAGDYSLLTGEGVVNVPISDTVALRAAATYTKHDGYVENLDDGSGDFYDRDDYAARVSLKLSPSDALTSTFMLDLFKADDNGAAVKLTAVNLATPLGRLYASGFAANQGDKFFSLHSDVDNFSKVTVWGASNTTTLHLNDSISLKNIVAYRDLDLEDLTDLDGVSRFTTGVPASLVGGNCALIPQLGPLATLRGGLCNLPFQFDSQQFSRAQQFTEELQLIGKGERLNWIAGLYYFDLHGRDGSIAKQFTLTNQRSVSGATGGLENKSYAAFAQGTYALTDTVNLTLGARYTKDKRELTTQARLLDPPFPAAGPCNLIGANGSRLPADACELNVDADFSEPTWNASLDWKFAPGQLAYLAHRHGYRSGGLNGRGTTPSTLEPFDPETVDDYELGYKSDFYVGGQAVRFNAAVYYQDYKDIQRLNAFVLNGILQNTIVNAASATIKGGELELTWLPIADLELSGYYAYVDAKYDDFPACSAASTTTTGCIPIDKSANKFSGIPKNSAGATVRYRLPFGPNVGDIWLTGNGYYQSAVALTAENRVDSFGLTCQGVNQDSYKVYNARVDWENVTGHQNLTVSAWGKNLNQAKYFTSGLCLYNNVGITQTYLGDPRTYGVEFAYKFGG